MDFRKKLNSKTLLLHSTAFTLRNNVFMIREFHSLHDDHHATLYSTRVDSSGCSTDGSSRLKERKFERGKALLDFYYLWTNSVSHSSSCTHSTILLLSLTLFHIMACWTQLVKGISSSNKIIFWMEKRERERERKSALLPPHQYLSVFLFPMESN
jgi:hypothetical protein